MARWYPEQGDTIRGLSGTTWTVGERLGRGGQGAVFAQAGGDLAIKIYGRATPEVADRRRRRLRELIARRTASNALVMPSELLAPPYVGYVMERVEDHRPIGDLAIPPRDSDDLLKAWNATGGLRVRLALGEALARAFREIHLAGLAYGDLSFDNVLVPRRGAPSIKLIDCDNLVPAGSGLADVQGTPWFIAPEVLAGRRAPDSLSDSWSLAVLLYHLLVLSHPLLGDAVRAGSPVEEERALHGHLPWVDHPEDEQNRSSAGMKRDLVLTRGLAAAFQQAFGRGMLDPTARPSEGDLLDILGIARDSLLPCGSCGFEHYFQRACPVCGETRERGPFLVFQRGRDAATGRVESRPVVVPKSLGLRGRHLLFEANGLDDRILIEVRRKGAQLHLTNRSDLTLSVADGNRVEMVRRDHSASMERGAWLRLGEHGVRAELRV